MNSLKQFLLITENMFSDQKLRYPRDIVEKYGFCGTEVYMNAFRPRTEPLFENESERDQIIHQLKGLGTKRIHCSYWGYPTSFLTKNFFKELVERAGSLEAVRTYYGDLSGEHIYCRWLQEYESACRLRADAYVFHVIDYAFVDGAWDFSLTREEVLQAMIGMVQKFLLLLDEKGLLSDSSPVIELENAGWGLEYGVQRSEDFSALFAQVYDPHDKLRIGWDINHLLHAIGWNEEKTKIVFQLGSWEITDKMKQLEEKETDPFAFTIAWLKQNLLDDALAGKVHSLHLSDSKWKEYEFFRNGRLRGKYAEIIDRIEGNDAKSDYGVGIVLDHYDSHLPLGEGVLRPKEMREIIEQVRKDNPELVLLHELKNSIHIESDIKTQLTFLSEERRIY